MQQPDNGYTTRTVTKKRSLVEHVAFAHLKIWAYIEHVPPMNVQIHMIVVLKNTKCGVEEHRVQLCNEVVWAITRSVCVQPFMTRTIAHHTHGPVGSTQQYGEVTIRFPPRPPSGWLSE